MMNIYNNLSTLPDELEINYIQLIENELSCFFDACDKSAYAYFLSVVRNKESCNKATFEKMVLNDDAIMELADNITNKINTFLGGFSLISAEYVKQGMNEWFPDGSMKALNRAAAESKTTIDITMYCEKVINKAVLKSLELFLSEFLSDKLFSSVNFGTLLLGRNNSRALTEKHEKLIYRQLQGMLLNVKMELRNVLLKNVIELINDYDYDMKTA